MKAMSKRNKLISAGCLLVILMIGVTYAWWKASLTTTTTIAMGELGIEGEFQKAEEEIYEPGLMAEMTGHVKNTGSIETIMRVENGSEIKFKYADDNKTPITDTKFVADQEEAVQLSFGPSGDDFEQEGVYWFYNKQQPSERYILLEPQAVVNVVNEAQFDGDVMTNKYQGAVVKAGGKIVATQVIEGAVAAEFGLALSDLKGISNGTAIGTSARQLADLSLNRADLKLAELRTK